MPSLLKLRNLITTSTNLSEVLDYFLKLTEEKNFIPSSTPLDEQEAYQNDTVKILIEVVERTAGNFLKRAIHVNHAMLCLVEKEHFYHGGLVLAKHPIPLSVFYFSDLNKGFFSMCGVGNNTEMFRFSLVISDKPPVINQSQHRH